MFRLFFLGGLISRHFLYRTRSQTKDFQKKIVFGFLFRIFVFGVVGFVLRFLFSLRVFWKYPRQSSASVWHGLELQKPKFWPVHPDWRVLTCFKTLFKTRQSKISLNLQILQNWDPFQIQDLKFLSNFPSVAPHQT